MNVRFKPMPVEPSSEKIILRLFRCMESSEQYKLIENALQILGSRCSFDPHHRYFKKISPDVIEDELNNNDLDERFMYTWPSEWPRQEIVDLDYIGDTSIWLERVLGERVTEVLFGSTDLEVIAANIAEEYLREIRMEGLPLPSDFGPNATLNGWTEEDEEQVQVEFLAFLRYWRECIIQTLETQYFESDN